MMRGRHSRNERPVRMAEGATARPAGTCRATLLLGLASCGLALATPLAAQETQEQPQQQDQAQPAPGTPPETAEPPSEAEPAPLQQDLLMPFDPDAPVPDEAEESPPVVEPDEVGLFGDDADSFAGLNVLTGFGLRFGASSSFIWTDNFRRAAAGAPRRSEVRIVPSASLSAGHPLGRQALYLNANVGWTFHMRSPQFDSERIGVGGGLQWRLGTACAGALDLGWSRQQAQFDLFDEVRPSIQSRLGASFGGRCNAPGRFITSFGVSTGRFRYDGGQREFANADSFGVNGGIGYPVGLAMVVGVNAGWNENSFPNQILLTGETLKTESVSVGGYVQYRVGPFLNLSGSVGWSEVTSNSPFQPGFDGVTWNVGAAYGSGRLGFRLGAGRSVSGGDGRFGNVAVLDSISAVATYVSPGGVRFSGGYARSKRNNRVSPLLVPPEFVGVDTVDNRLFASAGTRLFRFLSASLSANYVTRDSNRFDFQSDSTTITLNLRTAF